LSATQAGARLLALSLVLLLVIMSVAATLAAVRSQALSLAAQWVLCAVIASISVNASAMNFVAGTNIAMPMAAIITRSQEPLAHVGRQTESHAVYSSNAPN
jgi:Na+/H+ antiporter NhaC